MWLLVLTDEKAAVTSEPLHNMMVLFERALFVSVPLLSGHCAAYNIVLFFEHIVIVMTAKNINVDHCGLRCIKRLMVSSW